MKRVHDLALGSALLAVVATVLTATALQHERGPQARTAPPPARTGEP